MESGEIVTKLVEKCMEKGLITFWFLSHPYSFRLSPPLTITHKDIIRYFMTIPEACQLVLEACSMGEGGEIYIFDMGKPLKIIDVQPLYIYIYLSMILNSIDKNL